MRFNMSTTGFRACETMSSNLGKNSRSSIENQLAQSDSSLNAIKNGKRTMMIRCILTELLECKDYGKNAYVSYVSTFWNYELQLLCQEASHYHGSLTICGRHSMHYRSM